MKELTQKGMSCLEFKTVFDGDIATVLVDKETMLPIRLEVDRGEIKGESRREVISDFAFNEDLDAGLFAVEAPASYVLNRVERVKLDTSTSNYVVSVEEGMGPIRFGMSLNEVVNLLGEPESFESKPGMTAELDESGKPVILPGKGFKLIPADPPYEVAMLTYASRGFRISISSIDGVTNIHCFDAQAYGFSSRKFLGKTSHGIEIGMAKEEAKRLLPEAKDHGPILSYNGMSIELLDGKCHAIRVNAVSRKGTNAMPQ